MHTIASRVASNDVHLNVATAGDLPFLDRLRREHSKALGFLSHRALAEKIELGQVRVATLCGRSVGFVLHGSLRMKEVRVFQLAVEPSARGVGVARLMLDHLRTEAKQAGATGLSLRCRHELSANGFWHRAGFVLYDLEPARDGALFVWVDVLGEPSVQFHSRWHACPMCGEMTCGSWDHRAVRRRICGACWRKQQSEETRYDGGTDKPLRCFIA